MELDFRTDPGPGMSLRASYSCPCGCTPSVTYERGADVVTDSCCCGNQFAVGPAAENHVHLGAGFHLDRARAEAPWGETVPVAWAIGPSTHGSAPDSSHGDDAHGEHDHGEHDHGASGEPDRQDAAASAIDPVCGMTVDREASRNKGLHSSYKGADYFFCGRGCKLEFDEDPGRYLDPSYAPSM
jgi:YHS domain-containing protein